MATWRLGVLGKREGWYVRDLQRAARDMSVEVLGFPDLAAGCGPKATEVWSHTQSETPARQSLGGAGTDLDAVLVRTMPLGSVEQIIFRMNVLHAAQRSGLTVLNSPRSLEIAIDKWLTLDCLQQAGLPVLPTIGCQTREAALLAWDRLGRDCVVKPLFGGEGRGILRVSDEEMAWRVFGTLENLQSVIYLQAFLSHPGYDLRLLVIGDEIYAVKRASGTDWRTNLSRGATAIPYEPSEEERAMALQAARAIGGEIVGVDLLPSISGEVYVLELNAVPGWRGTGRALQVDVGRKVVEYVVGRLEG